MVLTLILTAMTTAVAAGPADLSLFPSESSSRIDSFTSYEMQVENVGPVKDTFKFSSSSPSEISIAPGETTLEAGESKTVNVWYNPSIDKDEGTYSFKVHATSKASGERFSADGTVNIIKDHKVSIDVGQSAKTACLGETASYSIELTNEGTQAEEFELRSDYGDFSTERVNLEDGETKRLTLSISSDSPVERSFNVVASSTTSYAQQIKSVDFTSETCYESEMSIKPETQETAAFNQAEFEVSISNTGTKSDTFGITTSEGELADEQLEVSSGETASTTLSLRPEEIGTRTIEVNAEGNSRSSSTAELDVYNGMDISMGFTSSNPRYCEDEEASAEVTVSNTGEVAEAFSLSTSNGNLSASSINLEAGESDTLQVDLGNRDPGNYPVTVEATAETFGEPSVSKKTNVRVENCYDLEMDVLPEVVSAGENQSTVYEIRLNNTGTMENTYKLSTDGPEWIDLGNDEVKIGPGSSEKVYLYAGIPFKKQGEVVITATATGTEIQKSEKVRLVVGEDIEEAIESEEDQISGSFSQSISNFVNQVEGSMGAKIIASIVAGIGIVLSALYLV